MSGSSGTVLNANYLGGVGALGHGVGVNEGSVGLSMSSNTLTGGLGGLLIGLGNTGRFIISTNTFQNAARYGLLVEAQGAGAEVWITSNTILPPFGNGASTTSSASGCTP